MPRLGTQNLPTEDDLLGVLGRWGCLSLRALCHELWPELAWLPLHDGDDSLAGRSVEPGGLTRALWVWLRLGFLIECGRLRVAGCDPHEVDGIGAVAFEILGTRIAAA